MGPLIGDCYLPKTAEKSRPTSENIDTDSFNKAPFANATVNMSKTIEVDSTYSSS